MNLVRKLGVPGVLSVFAALLVIMITVLSPEGWIMAVAFWQVPLFGLLMLAIAIWKRRNWWLLLLLPILLAPLIVGGLLLYACSQGTCL